ncbi:hypothetical protein L228DRAFT_286269 [Xylona heveae TC161]|uniref:DNA replication factor Cdt1 C-terminal domain-containing protein n=1 Tax=Xylona heveae (strain CBS 132557 / TC161) TaxID=1328760 RepID=A0A164ZFL1_XYLHT|nr:hypothetical protein L228DRAFT_286269 [Xylona heveae TC161]KZF19040.1 hypothetical protein L228DRAFT_286269 [Xylona heveae TC161]
MPPSAKRRKLTATTGQAPFFSPTQSGIQAFGRISKPQVVNGHALEKEQVIKQEQLLPTDGNRLSKIVLEKKRKIDSDTTQPVTKTEEFPATVLQPTKNIEQRYEGARFTNAEQITENERQVQSTPRRSARFAEPTFETPTKGACGLLNAFALSTPKSAKTTRTERETTPCPVSDEHATSNEDLREGRLPEAVQDLFDLHESFLTALAIHRAHNGSLVPADLRVLCPSIERAWGKRNVRVEDIKRVLGIQEMFVGSNGKKIGTAAILSLSDYGMGKICLEVDDARQDGERLLISDGESGIKALFKRNVEQAWADWAGRNIPSNDKAHSLHEMGIKAGEGKDRGESFIQQLPLARVTPCSSLAKASPLLKKGQRRLEEFKIEATLVRQDRHEKAVGAGSLKASNSVSDRGQGLLARIREKQLRQSTLPGAPSKEEVARKSALQRIDEVSSVLSLLGSPEKSTDEIGVSLNSRSSSTNSSLHVLSTASYKRVSFTLPTLIQNLQGSLRTPISKDEGELCIHLLAERVAPEWISLFKTGRVLGVVLKQGYKPSAAEMKSRVAACM